jgi:hypothetical protein
MLSAQLRIFSLPVQRKKWDRNRSVIFFVFASPRWRDTDLIHAIFQQMIGVFIAIILPIFAQDAHNIFSRKDLGRHALRIRSTRPDRWQC